MGIVENPFLFMILTMYYVEGKLKSHGFLLHCCQPGWSVREEEQGAKDFSGRDVLKLRFQVM